MDKKNRIIFQIQGQNNYIYTRKLNKGNADALNITTDVYWSEVSTLPTPNLWNYIGTSSSVNVPMGNTLVVADPITWNKDDIPGTGHYCFVGITGNVSDPKTLTQADVANFATSGLTWDGFKDLIRNNNNVAWRNFNVVDVYPDFRIVGPFDFNINGAFDKDRQFTLKIKHDLEKLDLVIPKTFDKEIRDIVINDFNFIGEGAFLGLTKKQRMKRISETIKPWFKLISYKTLLEASRRSQKIKMMIIQR